MRGALASLRAILIASILVLLYYLLPLDDGPDASTIAALLVGLLVFFALVAWQLQSILRSRHPAVRALEALVVAVPLFLLLFATTYYSMSQAAASNFSEPLTKTDSLYFTVTVFSTVGFGDISAQSEAGRLLVTGQMLLDLIILGLGIRVIVSAVERGRARSESEDGSESATR